MKNIYYLHEIPKDSILLADRLIENAMSVLIEFASENTTEWRAGYATATLETVGVLIGKFKEWYEKEEGQHEEENIKSGI